MAITPVPGPDERRRQQSISVSLRDTFQRINFSQVFRCESKACGRVWLGKDLHKKSADCYVCPDCSGEVIDVTDSSDGRTFLDIVLPGWRKQ